MTQMEIVVPAQSPRVTLGQARVLRDQLEKKLTEERPMLGTDITAVALRFRGADEIYRKIRPTFYHKRRLDSLYELSCFINAIEAKQLPAIPARGRSV
jgi:hypothetical protein